MKLNLFYSSARFNHRNVNRLTHIPFHALRATGLALEDKTVIYTRHKGYG